MKRVILVALIFGAAGWTLGSARQEIRAHRQAVETTWNELSAAMRRRAALAERIPGVGGGAKAGTGTREARLAAFKTIESGIARAIGAGGAHQWADDLDTTANDVAVKRQRYNEALLKYNVLIQVSPYNWTAHLFGYTRDPAYFKTEPAAGGAPKVSF
jgi:hypothetical protein